VTVLTKPEKPFQPGAAHQQQEEIHMFHRAHPAKVTKRSAALVLAAAVTLALAACSGAGSGGQTAANSAADKFGTASHPITLKFWTWGGTKPTAMVAAYEKLHPHIKLDVTLFGGTADLYTKLATVLKAGTGAPDATGLELMTLPSFAADGKLVDLSKYGVSVADYDKSAVNASTIDGKLYSVPTDTGPLVMYYRTDVFSKLGLSVPTTWADYMTDAEKVKAAGGSMAPIDPGDSSLPLGLIWQAGGRPFNLTGASKLNVNFADAGTKKMTDYWTQMIQNKLVTVTPSWSNDWFGDLAKGHYATGITGAWGGQTLAGSIPQSDGDWKVAQIPQWDASAPADGVWGGSGTAVTAQSQHPAAAAAFADWFGSTWKLTDVADSANQPFPASEKVLKNSQFLAATSKLLGGQAPDPLYVQASATVSSGWQFLPYQLYANTIYADTVGKALTSSGDFAAGLAAWQQQIVTYGTQQGFTVTTK
jgi:multiple sugar transport system substrate-binding protein